MEKPTITSGMRAGIALRGLAAILFGIIALAWPTITVLGLLVVFGIYALVDGVSAILGSVYYRRILTDRWLVLLIGIFSVLVGLLTFARPGLTALLLLLFIGARAMVIGLLEIGAAVHFRKVVHNEWMLVLAGVIGVLFGLIVFIYPYTSAMALVWVVGLYALIVGIVQLIFAITAREFEERYPEAATQPPMPA